MCKFLADEVNGNLNWYDDTFHVVLRMKGISIEDWVKQQKLKQTPGDELTIFALSVFYQRHTIIYTRNCPWCTVRFTNTITPQELHDKCKTHLIYLGGGIYGQLYPRPYHLVSHCCVNVQVLQHVNHVNRVRSKDRTDSEPMDLTVHKKKLPYQQKPSYQPSQSETINILNAIHKEAEHIRQEMHTVTIDITSDTEETSARTGEKEMLVANLLMKFVDNILKTHEPNLEELMDTVNESHIEAPKTVNQHDEWLRPVIDDNDYNSEQNQEDYRHNQDRDNVLQLPDATTPAEHGESSLSATIAVDSGHIVQLSDATTPDEQIENSPNVTPPETRHEAVNTVIPDTSEEVTMTLIGKSLSSENLHDNVTSQSVKCNTALKGEPASNADDTLIHDATLYTNSNCMEICTGPNNMDIASTEINVENDTGPTNDTDIPEINSRITADIDDPENANSMTANSAMDTPTLTDATSENIENGNNQYQQVTRRNNLRGTN